MGVKTRDPPRSQVKSWHFANAPARAHHVDQRDDVVLVHPTSGPSDPHTKALLTLVRQGQHIAGHVYDGVRRPQRCVLARVQTDVLGVGRAVDRDEGTGDVAILVLRIGEKAPYREQLSALPGLVEELSHTITSTFGAVTVGVKLDPSA